MPSLLLRILIQVVQSVLAEKDRRIEDLTAETEEMVSQLIAAKMDSANGSFELQQSLRRCSQLKKRVQALGERVAALELKAAEGVMVNEERQTEEQERIQDSN